MDIGLFLLASEAGESSGFGINSDILETNLINIVIIVGLLFYAGRGFLGKILSQRLQTIESAITDAEKRKNDALAQLADRQEKLAQAQAECDRIRATAEADAKKAREAILATVASDIEKLRAAAAQEIATEQERVVIQLRQQVAEKALAKVREYLGSNLDESAQQQLIDRSIALLGDK